MDKGVNRIEFMREETKEEILVLTMSSILNGFARLCASQYYLKCIFYRNIYTHLYRRLSLKNNFLFLNNNNN